MRSPLPVLSLLALLVVPGAWTAAQDATQAATATGEAPAPAPSGAQTIRLSIAEAEGLAQKNSDEVRARAAALDAALGAVNVARASFYPKVSASASGAYLVNPPAGMTLAKGAFGTTTIPGLGSFETPPEDVVVVPEAADTYVKGNITFTQPIVAWGKIRAAVDMAAFAAQASLAVRDGAKRDAAREANRAYYSAKLARDSAPILNELHDLATAIVADRQASLDEGLGTRERLLSAEADLAAIEDQIVQAREGAQSALESLAALTGLGEGAAIDTVSDFRSRLPDIDEKRLKTAATSSSAEWQSSGARFREASRAVDLERGSSVLLPDLAFFASLDASGPRSGWTNSWTWDLSLGLSLSVDLFDAGASAAKIEEARSQRDAAAAALRGAETSARLSARRAVQAAREAEAALRKSEAHALWTAEVLKNARSSAENQLASRQELNSAAIQDAAARLDLLSARYAFEEALADLDRLAQGELK